MINYRVTKYNPIFRNEKGYYPDEYCDWISSFDIGKSFNGVELNLNEYLNTENNYVNSIYFILKELNIISLRIINISEFYYVNSKNTISELNINSITLFEKIKDVKEDQLIEWDFIESLIRANLRELVNCDLFDKNFKVKFGYDYYMYVHSDIDIRSSINEIFSIGLFPENLGELANKDIKRFIASSLKGESDLLNEFSIDVSFIPILELRKIFNFSDEHPIDGFYKINSETAEKMEKIIKYKFDLINYEYYLECEKD